MLKFLLHHVKLLLIGYGLTAWILFMSKHMRQIKWFSLSCFSVYSCSHCFCNGFQNFTGDTCSWDFQVINWFTEELCPIFAWRNPTQNPVFLLSELCSPGACLWMGFAFAFLGKCTKGVRVIILFSLYWLLLGTFCILEKIPLALYSYISPLAFVLHCQFKPVL